MVVPVPELDVKPPGLIVTDVAPVVVHERVEVLPETTAAGLAPNADITGAVTFAADDPVPVKATVCWLPEALSAIVSRPVLVPDAVGANFTLSVHEVPAAWEVDMPQVPTPPQVKSPVMVMLEKVSVAFPALETVTSWVALVVPTA